MEMAVPICFITLKNSSEKAITAIRVFGNRLQNSPIFPLNTVMASPAPASKSSRLILTFIPPETISITIVKDNFIG